MMKPVNIGIREMYRERLPCIGPAHPSIEGICIQSSINPFLNLLRLFHLTSLYLEPAADLVFP